MCGIVGMISKGTNGFQRDEQDAFNDLLIMDQIRGPDGTGVFGIHKNRQASMVKVGTNASNLVPLQVYNKFNEKIFNSFWAVFGHNRKATQGKISTRNSHPFITENIVLIHNGTLYNHKTLAETEVDSEAIAHVLEKDDPIKALQKVYGAYALVWYDKRDKLIHIARNEERPLFIGEGATAWVFSSEPGIMMAACGRNRVKLNDIEPIDAFHHLTFKTGLEFDIEKYDQHAPYNQQYNGYQHKHNYPSSSCATSQDEKDAFGDLPFELTPVGPAPTAKQQADDALARIMVAKPGEVIAKGTPVDFIVNKIRPSAITVGERTITGFEVVGKIPYGTTLHMDIIAFCDWARDMEELDEALTRTRDKNGHRWATCTISKSGYSNCGPWVRGEDVYEADFVKTYDERIPKMVWKHIVDQRVCPKCNRNIRTSECDVTSVQLKTDGTIGKVTCPDCIEKTLPERIKHAFIKSRNASVQVGEQLSQTASPTVH
jgi:hypothetical protein